LGAQAVIELGLGDDQATYGVDEIWDPWQERLWSIIETLFPVDPEARRFAEDVLLDPSYHIENVTEIVDRSIEKDITDIGKSFMDEDSEISTGDQSYSIYSRDYPYRARLMTNRRLTQEDHFQDVRHIEFDITESGMRFNPGDVVYVMPRNLRQDVDDFMERMGILELASKPIRIRSVDKQGNAWHRLFFPPLDLSMRNTNYRNGKFRQSRTRS
jgi:sulfite reductase alpha subunit-like flavoprotein